MKLTARSLFLFVVLAAAVGIGASPRFLEEIAGGGGFGDAKDGGAWLEADGDMLTDGAVTAENGLNAGANDTTRGTMNLYGGSAAGGGTVNLWNGASDDTFTDRWALFAEPATGNFALKAIAGPSGATENVLAFDDATHDGTVEKNLHVKGGTLQVGVDGGTRGVVTAWDGSGGSAPGAIRLASPNGTQWYLFVEDDGTVKLHSALPTQNSDGVAVGIQF